MSNEQLGVYFDAMWTITNRDLVSGLVDVRKLNRAELNVALARQHTK